jgi:hypothetical protein
MCDEGVVSAAVPAGGPDVTEHRAKGPGQGPGARRTGYSACVALSRHRTHAHVLHDAETGRALTAASTGRPGDSAIAIQRHVLSRLTEHT